MNNLRRVLLLIILVSLCYVVFLRGYVKSASPLDQTAIVHTSCDPDALVRAKRVAIIGAGSGGASTAYYLNKFRSKCEQTVITVYERSDYVGGRSTTVNIHDDLAQPVELGASIFVKMNRNLFTAAEDLGLSIINAGLDRPHTSPEALGVWDGEGFRFVQSEGTSFWYDVAKLIWTYGLAPLRTQRLMQKTTGRFQEMYEAPYFPFRSLTEVSARLGLTDVTSVTGSVFLEQNGIGSPFSTDIIQASTRVNYAQNLAEIHGLEALVCMATDGAVAVQGGNWQIFDRMLQASSANVALNTSVSNISKQDDGSYLLKTTLKSAMGAVDGHHIYDAVVIAAPLQFSGIHISPEPEHLPDKIRYVNLQVTLFTTPHKISPIPFNLPLLKPPPEVILTTLPNSADRPGDDTAPAGFFSISTLRNLTNLHHSPPRLEYLYKIFSPKPLNSTLVSRLFGFLDPKTDLQNISKDDISWIYEKSWRSYPYLPPRVTFDGPYLDKDLWYTSGIETFISTMETSSLMGMNVAKLMVDSWREAPTEKMQAEL